MSKKGGLKLLLQLFKRRRNQPKTQAAPQEDSIDDMKRAVLKMGGWSDEDIQRMNSREAKKNAPPASTAREDASRRQDYAKKQAMIKMENSMKNQDVMHGKKVAVKDKRKRINSEGGYLMG